MSDTVCIAAVCVPEKTDRVFAILCSDSRVEIADLGSGDIGFKGLHVAPGIAIMYAGSVPKAREMVERYKYHLAKPDVKITHENVLDVLDVPLQAQRRREASNYLSATYGMSYEEYLSRDAASQQTLLYGLASWKDHCDLIVVWIGDGFVRLFLVSDKVTEQSSFVTIGTGASVATASLFSRGYKAHADLREALYYVYEAKRNSENVPGVGAQTFIEICEFSPQNGTHIKYPLMTNEVEILQRQFSVLGPQPFRVLDGDAKLSLDFIPGSKPASAISHSAAQSVRTTPKRGRRSQRPSRE